MSAILDRLRSDTNAIHLRLHHHPILCELTEKTLTRSYYIRALQAFEPFYTSAEEIISHWSNHYAYEPSSHRLREDLMVLGVAENPFPEVDLPGIQHTDQLFGLLYVLEGSRLGGQVLARNIKKILALKAGSGTSFFSGSGKDTAKNWKQFLLALELASPDIDLTVEAAVKTFDLLEKWLWYVHSLKNEVNKGL